MVDLLVSCALIALAQQTTADSEKDGPATWAEYYQDTAKQYRVKPADDRRKSELTDHAVFNWASIDNYHGAVFAWTENGRPTIVATIFSFPLQGSQQRLAVHEFASFAEADLVVDGPDGRHWKPPPLQRLQRVPDSPAPQKNASLLKLQCRRLAKDFSAHMNRRGERWDLRLLPTPLVEYQPLSADTLGGALFAFVGYSTDPEILLLLEARETSDVPAWQFHAVRFSDKSLYLNFKDRPVWESLRKGHGFDGPDTEDPFYHVLASQRLSPDLVEKLSTASAKE